MSALTAAARWIAGRTRLSNDLPAAEARLAELEANPPSSADPAEHLGWAERRDGERRNVEALRSALAIATAEAAKAEAAQAHQDADAQHAAAEKQAAADAHKLVPAARSTIGLAVQSIEALVASIEATEMANAARGERPFIVDAETRVRQIPGRTIEAVYEDRVVWRDIVGDEPTVYRTNADGELEPSQAGFTRHVERVCVQPERIIPPAMPTRLAELLPALREALK